MSSDDRLIATRYVEALFDLAAGEKQQEAVKGDMEMLKTVLEGSSELQKLLVNPIISREESEKAIVKVLAAIKACELTQRFFVLMARNRRLALTSLAIENYLIRLAQSRGELTVNVTTAQALGPDELNALSDVIAKSTGKKVDIKVRENLALIGGIQVRVGSRMLDNTIAGKLSRLKHSLTNAA